MEDGPKQVSHAYPRYNLEGIVQEVKQQPKTTQSQAQPRGFDRGSYVDCMKCYEM